MFMATDDYFDVGKPSYASLICRARQKRVFLARIPVRSSLLTAGHRRGTTLLPWQLEGAEPHRGWGGKDQGPAGQGKQPAERQEKRAWDSSFPGSSFNGQAIDGVFSLTSARIIILGELFSQVLRIKGAEGQ